MSFSVLGVIVCIRVFPWPLLIVIGENKVYLRFDLETIWHGEPINEDNPVGEEFDLQTGLGKFKMVQVTRIFKTGRTKKHLRIFHGYKITEFEITDKLYKVNPSFKILAAFAKGDSPTEAIQTLMKLNTLLNKFS